MDSLRRLRRWLPAWLVPVLLCAQIATAAYACPQAATPVAEVATVMAEMPDCHTGMDPAQPQLCKAHCEAGQQSVNSNAGAASVPAPALIDARWARSLVCADAASTALVAPRSQSVGPPAGTPPLYLSLLVLRI
jgi:hypothetical protein